LGEGCQEFEDHCGAGRSGGDYLCFEKGLKNLIRESVVEEHLKMGGK